MRQERCEQCGGSGFLSIGGQTDGAHCPLCQGTGWVDEGTGSAGVIVSATIELVFDVRYPNGERKRTYLSVPWGDQEFREAVEKRWQLYFAQLQALNQWNPLA